MQIIRTVAWGVVLAAASALAQGQVAAPGHAPVPVVREGATVRISEHVHVILDGKVPMVPNVGIIVGTRGTLVFDPGMGRPSGEAVLREARKVSKGPELYIVNSHFHPEHTTGEMAFPPETRIIRAAAQQQDVEEMGMKWVQNFASRSPVIGGVLEGFTAFRTPTEIFERERVLDLGGVRARIIRLGPGHTRGDTLLSNHTLRFRWRVRLPHTVDQRAAAQLFKENIQQSAVPLVRQHELRLVGMVRFVFAPVSVEDLRCLASVVHDVGRLISAGT